MYLDWAMYNYVCSRTTSTTNIGLNEKTFNDLIPNFYERSAFLREIGREDLALLQDYFLYKRLLLFYTAVCRSQDPKKKEHKAFFAAENRSRKRLLCSSLWDSPGEQSGIPENEAVFEVTDIVPGSDETE